MTDGASHAIKEMKYIATERAVLVEITESPSISIRCSEEEEEKDVHAFIGDIINP